MRSKADRRDLFYNVETTEKNCAMTRREPQSELLLEVWKEIGRHAELDQSLGRLAGWIAREVALDRIILRRVDLPSAKIETAATAEIRPTNDQPAARAELGDSDVERLLDWFRAGVATAWKSGATDGLRKLLEPEAKHAALLAGPLSHDGHPAGVLLFESTRNELCESIGWVDALIEPMSVALSNQQRLHELARLREAAEADNRALLSRLQREDISESVVGADTGLREVMERVEQVARTDAPVLILGETGSGKEVVARNIHARSRRAKGPFLRVNCGAIPQELVDSELFGHERGSFTGAVNTRRGWFERADGGTLFLDELGELPQAAQVRLLRVLQDGTFERVGGQTVLHVDVRIVAATHRDMQSLVGEGTFRQDLWYRINVFPIRLPPLRERESDIPALAAHFAARAGLRLHGVPLSPTPEDIRALLEYDWPGNVRELASVIERAAILGDGRHLAVRAAIGPHTPSARVDAHDGEVAPRAGSDTSESLEAAMVKHIHVALEKTRGRIEGPFGAASLLGINPHTLRSRMRKLGIDWSRYRSRDCPS